MNDRNILINKIIGYAGVNILIDIIIGYAGVAQTISKKIDYLNKPRAPSNY